MISTINQCMKESIAAQDAKVTGQILKEAMFYRNSHWKETRKNEKKKVTLRINGKK